MRNDHFRDCTGSTPKPLDLWEPIVIPKQEIDARRSNGWRICSCACQWLPPLPFSCIRGTRNLADLLPASKSRSTC